MADVQLPADFAINASCICIAVHSADSTSSTARCLDAAFTDKYSAGADDMQNDANLR